MFITRAIVVSALSLVPTLTSALPILQQPEYSLVKHSLDAFNAWEDSMLPSANKQVGQQQQQQSATGDTANAFKAWENAEGLATVSPPKSENLATPEIFNEWSKAIGIDESLDETSSPSSSSSSATPSSTSSETDTSSTPLSEFEIWAKAEGIPTKRSDPQDSIDSFQLDDSKLDNEPVPKDSNFTESEIEEDGDSAKYPDLVVTLKAGKVAADNSMTYFVSSIKKVNSTTAKNPPAANQPAPSTSTPASHASNQELTGPSPQSSDSPAASQMPSSASPASASTYPVTTPSESTSPDSPVAPESESPACASPSSAPIPTHSESTSPVNNSSLESA